MTEDPEPDVNISGGETGGGSATAFETGTADTRAERIVDELGGLYWEKTYGGRDGFECLVRTILSQNTSDKASQPAHDALMDRYGAGGQKSATNDRGEEDLAAALVATPRSDLAETISSAGLYNQKAKVIQDVAEVILEEYGSTAGFDRFLREEDPDTVRETLLDLHGVGPKTADCVLLFAGGQTGVFPVDTHVHRIARRMGLAAPDADHEEVRAALEADIPGEKCGFGHTAMIQFGREYCSARKPACLDGPEACPLVEHCDQVGIDPIGETVVDPAEE